MDIFKRNNKKNNALELRPFRLKSPAQEFFCPLCRSEREVSVHHRLTIKNFVQIVSATTVTIILFWPIFELRSVVSFFLYWSILEFIRRSMYRKEIVCPYCGFDAAWYKRDVVKAKSIVKDFWENNNLDISHKIDKKNLEDTNNSTI